MVTYEWNEELCRRYADGLRPVTRFDHRRWAQRIAGELGALPPGATVLDVASGPGFLLVELGKLVPGLQLLAQDQAEPMLTIASEEAAAARLRVEQLCCEAESLTLEDEQVDVVTCKQLLHEAADPKRVAAEALRVLKPGGRLFLIDFDADGVRLAAVAIRTLLLLTRGRQIARDFWRSFSSALHGEEVRSMLLEAGFERADYLVSGCNFYISATKGGGAPG